LNPELCYPPRMSQVWQKWVLAQFMPDPHSKCSFHASRHLLQGAAYMQMLSAPLTVKATSHFEEAEKRRYVPCCLTLR
jgi:hypothetical protein